jgi:hypothetical protein
MLKSLLREPLVHFLLLGAALFALDAWLRPVATPAANSEIVVSEARIRNLAQNFSRTWQRPPTRELDGWSSPRARGSFIANAALDRSRRHDHPPAPAAEDRVHFRRGGPIAKPTVENQRLQRRIERSASSRAHFLQVYLDPRKRFNARCRRERLLATLNSAGQDAASSATA